MNETYLVRQFGRHCYFQVYSSCSRCPPFGRTHARRRCIHHSSVASTMTLWSLKSCQASNKRFFSSSMLCCAAASCNWCTLCWMSPHILQSTGLRSVLFGGHRSGGASVNCSKKSHIFHVPVVRVRFLIEKWRNRLTSRASRATRAAAVGSCRGNSRRWSSPRIYKDEDREAKLWDAVDGYHNKSTKRHLDAQLVANLNFNFSQVVQQHTLGVEGYII